MTEDDSTRVRVGKKVRDRVTGYEGIVVARTEWLYGCARVTVQADDTTEDGTPVDRESFDEPQVEVVGDGVIDDVEQAKNSMSKTGGPKDDPMRRKPGAEK